MTGPTRSDPDRDPSVDARERPGRRGVLRALAVTGALGLAGCGGSGGGEESSPATSPRRTPTATETSTRTATRTATGTATETPTGTATGTTTTAESLPTTGDPVPELEPIDEAVRSFVVENDVPAATLGVARNGEVLLERGYGWADEARTEPTPPDARFRIASNTKPLTKAALNELVSAGDLSMGTKAFRRLGIEPLPGDDPGDGVMDVTVEHLFKHRAGLAPFRSVNPMFDVDLTFEMAERMELSSPPTTRQRARFLLGRQPQFEPGTRTAYSNFGYAVLGLLVEEVAGVPLEEFVRSRVLDGVAADEVYAGRTLPSDRRGSEVDYYSPRRGPNVYELDREETVPLPDGGFHLEALGGAGSFVATTRGLLSFLGEYWVTGARRTGSGGRARYYGSLPGTFTMAYQHRSGTDVVVLSNYRGPTPRGFQEPLTAAVGEGIDAVEDWP